LRICCFGDIHYCGDRKRLERLARLLSGGCAGTDVVVVVGDLTCDGNLEYAREVLETVKRALDTIPVLVIPGNHDVYLTRDEMSEGVDSLQKLLKFNRMVEELGFIPLMEGPFILDGVAFVGSMRWYDYSFAPEWLNLPLEAYRAKAFGLQV
jgi:predicted MPP superfamily phosphohydrolase